MSEITALFYWLCILLSFCSCKANDPLDFEPRLPDYKSTTPCLRDYEVCEFILLVEERLTMTCPGKECDLLIPENGSLFLADENMKPGAPLSGMGKEWSLLLNQAGRTTNYLFNCYHHQIFTCIFIIKSIFLFKAIRVCSLQL